MYKFENVTTLERLKEGVEANGIKIEQMQLLSVKPQSIVGKMVWKMTDKFKNEWNILFTGRVDEWSVFSVDDYNPFKVNFISSGNVVGICRAEKAGRKYKADRYLKQYIQITLLVNSLIQYGYLKC